MKTADGRYLLPSLLRISCPHPECKHKYMRARGAILRADLTFERMYVCPQCGEKEVVTRKVVELPEFRLQRGVQK